MKQYHALAGVIICLCASMPFAQTKKPLVAINNLEARGITADEAATLTDVMRSEMINTGKFRVMERSQMESILKEQGFQQTGACNNEQCMVEMGQLLGAENMVAGSIGKIGKAYSINVRMFSVKTGEIIGTVSQSYAGAIEGLLTTEIPAVAKKLASSWEASAAPVVQPSARDKKTEVEQAVAQQPATKEKKPEMKKKGGAGTGILIGAGVAVIGGTAAAILLMRKGETGGTTPPVQEKTSIQVTW
jgi:hypothetical protein